MWSCKNNAQTTCYKIAAENSSSELLLSFAVDFKLFNCIRIRTGVGEPLRVWIKNKRLW